MQFFADLSDTSTDPVSRENLVENETEDVDPVQQLLQEKETESEMGLLNLEQILLNYGKSPRLKKAKMFYNTGILERISIKS